MKLSKKFRRKIKKSLLSMLGIIMISTLMFTSTSDINGFNLINAIKTTTAGLFTKAVNEPKIADAKIVGGNNHFVALKTDGTVYTWGGNEYGQLGNGTNTNVLKPTKVIENAIDVAAGEFYTMILKQDGTVWTTGYNDSGRLGDGTGTSSNIFKQVKLNAGGGYLENIIAIDTHRATSYALSSSGEVYSWGYNGNYQFGTNTISTSKYPVKMNGISDIVQISAGYNHVAMLNKNGNVWCTGYNGYGQFGVNSTSTASLPVQMQDENGNVLDGVKAVASGIYHIMILKQDGTVWAAGYNGLGQLGNGTTDNSYKLVQVLKKTGENSSAPITDAKHIEAAGYSSYIFKNSDTSGTAKGMYVVGKNSHGELFTGDTTNQLLAKEVQTDKIILTGNLSSYGGDNNSGAIIDMDGRVYTVGFNEYGQLGNDTNQSLKRAWDLSENRINVNANIINLQIPSQIGLITANTEIGFNLLRNNLPASSFAYTSLDESVATVSSNGTVMAKKLGTTFIQIEDTVNKTYKRVKVNVNGENNITQAKVVRRRLPLCCT